MTDEQIREMAKGLVANITCGGNDAFFREHLPTRPDWQLLLAHAETSLRQLRDATLEPVRDSAKRWRNIAANCDRTEPANDTAAYAYEHCADELETVLASAPSLEDVRKAAIAEFLAVVTGHSAGSSSVKDWLEARDAQARAEGALEARLIAIRELLPHNYTYEGSCGVHMPSHCDRCHLEAESIAALERAKGASRECPQGN